MAGVSRGRKQKGRRGPGKRTYELFDNYVFLVVRLEGLDELREHLVLIAGLLRLELLERQPALAALLTRRSLLRLQHQEPEPLSLHRLAFVAVQRLLCLDVKNLRR